jgi:hypothetical protein
VTGGMQDEILALFGQFGSVFTIFGARLNVLRPNPRSINRQCRRDANVKRRPQSSNCGSIPMCWDMTASARFLGVDAFMPALDGVDLEGR